ncbi:MAG: signal transduction histidine kinase [Verrucomicrobiales bacterium]
MSDTPSSSAARLNLLLEVLLKIAGCDSVQQLLDAVASQLPWVLDFDKGAIASKPREPEGVLDWRFIGAERKPFGESERPLIEDAIAAAEVRSTPAFMATPLRSGGRCLGALALQTSREGGYRPSDFQFAEALANYVAATIDRIGKSEELSAANEQLEAYSEELERSNRELTDFAYVASHDLKEPLRVITGFSDLLKERCGPEISEKGQHYIERITTAASRMQRLISDLLEYSRAGTAGGELTPVDLGDVLDETLSNLEVAIRDSKAVVSRDKSLPNVLADTSQLLQVLQNLIGNAIKFGGDKIEVSARPAPEDESRWEVSVSDNGPGIAPEFQDRIFKIFERLVSEREVEGTGIGLAVCRRIVERHGGEIRVESEAGAGARFAFTLPDPLGSNPL